MTPAKSLTCPVGKGRCTSDELVVGGADVHAVVAKIASNKQANARSIDEENKLTFRFTEELGKKDTPVYSFHRGDASAAIRSSALLTPPDQQEQEGDH